MNQEWNLLRDIQTKTPPWDGYGCFLGQHSGKCLFPCVSDLNELVFINVFSISNNFCHNIIIRYNLL